MMCIFGWLIYIYVWPCLHCNWHGCVLGNCGKIHHVICIGGAAKCFIRWLHSRYNSIICYMVWDISICLHIIEIHIVYKCMNVFYVYVKCVYSLFIQFRNVQWKSGGAPLSACHISLSQSNSIRMCVLCPDESK